MNSLTTNFKFIAVAWVAAAVVYPVARGVVRQVHKRWKQFETRKGTERRLNAKPLSPVQWGTRLRFLAVTVVLILLATGFALAGWIGGSLAISSGFLAALYLGFQRYVIQESPADVTWDEDHRVPLGVDRRKLHAFDSWVTLFVRLAGPVGFMALLLIQDDWRFGGETWLPSSWRSMPNDSLAGCMLPAGLLALAVGHHALWLLHFSVDSYSVLRTKKDLPARLDRQVWIWALLAAALLAVCLTVRALGEHRLGRGIAIGLIAAYFVTVPITREPIENASAMLDRMRSRRAFNRRLGAFVRLASLPAAWWVAVVSWNTLPQFATARTTLITFAQGLLVALVAVCGIVIHALSAHGRRRLRIEHWPIAVTVLLVACVTAPIAIGVTAAGAAGLVAILTGTGLGYHRTWAPKSPLRAYFGTIITLWILGATACAALSPLGAKTPLPVMWPTCLLAVTGVGLVYGSVLRNRVPYRDPPVT